MLLLFILLNQLSDSLLQVDDVFIQLQDLVVAFVVLLLQLFVILVCLLKLPLALLYFCFKLILILNQKVYLLSKPFDLFFLLLFLGLHFGFELIELVVRRCEILIDCLDLFGFIFICLFHLLDLSIGIE